MSMYVRVKRRNQTFFMHVEPPDTFSVIKEKCGHVLDVPPSGIALYAGSAEEPSELADLATIGDQQIQNDAVLFMVLRTDDGWEPIELE